MTVNFMAPLDPSGIDAAGNGSLYFVPTLADPTKPTPAELAAGLNLSCLVYNWSPNGEQGKVERAKYCSRGTTERNGKVKYSADPIVYDYDPQNPASTEYPAYARFPQGTKGYVLDRRGIAYETAAAAGDYVDVYPVELGVRNRVAIDPTADGETLRISQAISIYSDPIFDAKITAGV